MVAASVSGADTPGTLYSVHRGPGAETYDHFTLFAAALVSSCLMCFVLMPDCLPSLGERE